MEARSKRFPCSRGRSPPWEFCPFCYENWKGRANHKGHLKYYPPVVHFHHYWEKFMKRPSQVPGAKKGQWSCADSEFLEKYPLLAAGCCDPWWDDGKPRTPWTLTVRFEAENVNVCLNDKDADQGSYTTSETLADCFEAIELALKNDSLSWRRWKKR